VAISSYDYLLTELNAKHRADQVSGMQNRLLAIKLDQVSAEDRVDQNKSSCHNFLAKPNISLLTDALVSTRG